MTKEETSEMFGGFRPEEHEAEAEQRWGHTNEWQQSKQRTARYTKADWAKIKDEAAGIYGALAALMAAGRPPDSAEAMDAAEQHRQHISRWFYDCSLAVHRGLGELYVADARFTANIDKVAPGLARYCCDAFAASAARSSLAR
jgi:hypothetical protein